MKRNLLSVFVMTMIFSLTGLAVQANEIVSKRTSPVPVQRGEKVVEPAKSEANYVFIENFEGAETLELQVFANGSWEIPEALVVIDNPDRNEMNPSAKVLQFTRGADGAPWAGFFTDLDEPIDFSEKGYIQFQVWKPIASRVLFKVEGSTIGASPVEIPAMEPQEATNEWVNMVFDCSELEGGWSRIVFFLDFPENVTHTDHVVMYMDNIVWSETPDPVEIPGPEGLYFLSWDVSVSANTPIYRQETYSVYISTEGDDPENFTMLFEETLEETVPRWTGLPRKLDISAYLGEEIHVAFRHFDSSDMDLVIIDNVKVYASSPGNPDLELVIFFEDFSGGIAAEVDPDWLPEGWQAIDADGDGHNWFFGVREGNGAMRSASWDPDDEALMPDNWLFTPAITLEEPYTIWSVVQESDVHTQLEALVLLAGLEGALQGQGPLTLFAPTDAAIAALPEELVATVVADPEGLLTNILLYHVVAGAAMSADLSDGQVITTLLGQNITVTINAEGVFINESKVIVADIEASNGVVHVIDAVLVPTIEPPPSGFEVTFNVDMAGAVAEGGVAFDPAVHRVWVTGSFADWAQPGTNPDFELTPAKAAKDNVQIIYPGNWANRTGEATYVWSEGNGYIFGTNTYGDAGYGQVFKNDKELTIVGGYFWIGERLGTGGDVVFKLWDYSGNSVGTVLASKTVALADIDSGEEFEDAFYVEFDEPATVTGDFFLGADISGLSGFQDGLYGIGNVSSQNGNGGNAGLALVQEGTDWVAVTAYGVDVDIAIFAVAEAGEVQLEPLIYTLTTYIEEGEYVYKYFLVGNEPTWGLGEWPGDPNRELVVVGAMVQNDVFGEQPGDPTNVDDPIVQGFAVYPNPVRDVLNIQAATNIDVIRVFDLSGRIIHQAPVNDTHVQLNVNPFARGMYILQVISGNEVQSHRFQVYK
jgi:hypothetical protein